MVLLNMKKYNFINKLKKNLFIPFDEIKFFFLFETLTFPSFYFGDIFFQESKNLLKIENKKFFFKKAYLRGSIFKLLQFLMIKKIKILRFFNIRNFKKEIVYFDFFVKTNFKKLIKFKIILKINYFFLKCKKKQNLILLNYKKKRN